MRVKSKDLAQLVGPNEVSEHLIATGETTVVAATTTESLLWSKGKCEIAIWCLLEGVVQLNYGVEDETPIKQDHDPALSKDKAYPSRKERILVSRILQSLLDPV